MIVKLAQALELLEQWEYEMHVEIEQMPLLRVHSLRAKVEIAHLLSALVLGTGQQANEELAKAQK